MGASLTLAGVTACTRQPAEETLPYVRQPEELVPGKPLFYATAMPFAGAGMGLLVESHEGRPTKIEGNPDHPTSRGATDIFAQAAILNLYDPDRSQTLTHLGEIRHVRRVRRRAEGSGHRAAGIEGAGLRILSETVTSPTLNAQIDELLGRFPQAKWVQWEPFGRHNAREGSRLAFGEYVDAQYAIEKADVMLSLDADFLCSGGGATAGTRAPSRRAAVSRATRRNSPPLRRGVIAVQHRLEGRSPPAAARLGDRGLRPRGCARGRRRMRQATASAPPARSWVAPLVKDLQAARGRSLVIAGDTQPPAVHALAHAMNEALGNVGATVTYTQTAEARPSNQLEGLRELVGEMNAGTVTSCSFSAATRSTRRRPT